MFPFEIVQLNINYMRIAIHQDKEMNRMGTQTDQHKLHLPKKMEKTVLSNPFMGYNYYFLNSPPGPDC